MVGVVMEGWSIIYDPKNKEWQVSDGDVGERSTSYDFKTKEEAEEWLTKNGGGNHALG
tara:strand:+ start:282 stop:455 length:174 start_codon:yes stop_codon:yes gene_type:complete